jgi:hypothetical protein
VRVRRLRVVDEPDAVDGGDRLATVGFGRERPDRLRDRVVADRERVGRGGGGRGVGAHRRRVERERTEIRAAPPRRQPAVTDARPVFRWLTDREPPDLTRGRARDRGGRLVVEVPDVDVGRTLEREHPRLRRRVRVERAVPIQMVRRQVEQHRDPRVERRLRRKLEGGDLDDEHVVGLPGRRRERPPDVAARHGVQTGRPQACGEQAGGGRLAVRPGHGDVRRPGEPGAEFELAPHGEPPIVGPRDDLGVGRHPRARDDDRRAVEVVGGVTALEHLDPLHTQV